MATNGGNLPALIKYNKIKDVTIYKLPGSMKSGSFNSAYGIKFTEIIEEKVVKRGIFRNKTEIKTNEIARVVPFSFKTLEIAKDFAQYLPEMSIWGDRLYENSGDTVHVKSQVMYETYIIKAKDINANIGVKFLDECLHPTQQTIKKKETSDGSAWHEYYINDLDKKNFDGSQGRWYDHTELVVDYFFTTYEFNFDLKQFIPRDKFETLGERQAFENENTHKFILVEN